MATKQCFLRTDMHRDYILLDTKILATRNISKKLHLKNITLIRIIFHTINPCILEYNSKPTYIWSETSP